MTAQGYDGQFGTNVLGHFFLTQLLLPVLLRTARGETSGAPCRARIVTVAANAAASFAPSEGINWDTLQKGEAALKARKKVGTRGLYGQSKLGNVVFSNELARRYGDEGLVCISLHPGVIKTGLQRHSALMKRIANAVAYDISYGVITQLYAATSEEALQMNGEYLTAWARRTDHPGKWAKDRAMAERVWDWCEDQVKGFSSVGIVP